MHGIAFDLNPEKLLGFYESQLDYYRKWSSLHKLSYWGMVWLSVLVGTFLGIGLLLRVDMTYIAVLGFALNVVLIAGRVLGSDQKWARYRTTEIRMQFAFQAMLVGCARQIAAGKSRDLALLEGIDELRDKVEHLVLEEFSDFFRNVRSLDEIQAELAKQKAMGLKLRPVESPGEA